MKLKIAGIVNDSIVDGAGIRLTVFLQCCPHHCKGCHNPQTHDPKGGKEVDNSYILDLIRKNPLLDGITFSGGEPFEQAKSLCVLADEIKSEFKDLNITTYTGYTFEWLLKRGKFDKPEWLELLNKTDILIDGRFVVEKKSYDLKYRGSSNQRYIDCKSSIKIGEVILAD